VKTTSVLSVAAVLGGAFLVMGSGPARAIPSQCDAVTNNLVTTATGGNCGFERGPVVGAAGGAPSGWTLNGTDVSFTGVESFLPSVAHTGNGSMEFGSSDANATLSVAIATTPGTVYQLNFYLSNPLGGSAVGGSGNYFEVQWNGADPTAVEDGDPFLPVADAGTIEPYEDYDYLVTATSDTTVLSFIGLNQPAAFSLDDVCVVAATTSCVPEPGSMSLLGGALLALAGIRRKRKSA